MHLLRNAVQCLSCEEVIVSSHRHDFRTCKCGGVSVDGGLEYQRRLFKDPDNFIECCGYAMSKDSKPGDGAGKFIVWSPGGKTNPSMLFDRQCDAEAAATDLAARVKPSSDWYVAQLTHVSITKS